MHAVYLPLLILISGNLFWHQSVLRHHKQCRIRPVAGALTALPTPESYWCHDNASAAGHNSLPSSTGQCPASARFSVVAERGGHGRQQSP